MQWPWCLLFIVSSSFLPLSASVISISINSSISINQTIFSVEAIWVANRASPVPKGSLPVFRVSEDGNLVVLSGRKVVWTSDVSVIRPDGNLVVLSGRKVVWTSDVSVIRTGVLSADAVLLDNGNLVLRHGEDGDVWQSFDHPTDTFVSDMKISSNKKTGKEMRLTSWVNDEDPRPGMFSIGIDPNRHQVSLWKGDELYWRSGVYATSSSYATGFFKFYQGFSLYFSFVVEDDGEVYLVYSMSTNTVRSRFTLAPSGRIQLLIWVQTAWIVLWQEPLDTCDFYGYCGPFTFCQKNVSIPVCNCLNGFQPKSHNAWNVGNWTGGCVRNNTLSCDNGDGFVKYEGIKLPDHAVTMRSQSISECELECFKNCSCTAYAYENVTDEVTIVCLNWFRELVDLQTYVFNGRHIYVRVHSSKQVDDIQGHKSTHIRKSFIASAVAIVSIGLLIISVIGYIWRKERLIRKERIRRELLGFDSISTISGDAHNSGELVSFSLRSVLAATGSFSVKNKLGEGGFGPVYKGSLPGNREVAVKRLSIRSSQGRDEFMNELKLIAKLQHTNLVRLLGCCVEEGENILMYEYMPNRSLDKFLFDPSKSVNLDWNKRYKIIEGIAQGILYLHKYFRLKVIHRDLKASNVLLDHMITPKISYFGLARIFGMNQIEDKTNRVVGTFGYMAPEYALHGRFSERSDVFSFGVLLLEIVTGKRNSGTDCTLTVSEWAWEIWMDGRGVELIDPSLRDSCDPLLAVKCINVGLLCVQEMMNDRPTMSEVVVMLSNETASIPLPKKPAFTIHRSAPVWSIYSNNEVSTQKFRFELFSFRTTPVTHLRYDKEGKLFGIISISDKYGLLSDGGSYFFQPDFAHVPLFNHDWCNPINMINDVLVYLGNPSSHHSVLICSSIEIRMELYVTKKKNACYHLCNHKIEIDLSAFWDKKSDGKCGHLSVVGEDGSTHMYYMVLKDAVDTTLEIKFEKNILSREVSGYVLAYYGDDFLYECQSEDITKDYYTALLFLADRHVLKPSKIQLIKSMLAVPTKGSLVIKAYLEDARYGQVILKKSCIFKPQLRGCSYGTLSGWGDCSLHLKVDWQYQA
ncbi:G-type lectin S-receptor-like serine/threonine-protein kinase B120 [Tanacetum coccineum]